MAGRLVLAIPRYHTSARVSLNLLRLMGDGSGDSDNLDFPVLTGDEEQFTEALVQYLEENKQLWDFCELNTLPADSPAATALLDYLNRGGWKASSSQWVDSAIPLPDTGEAYLQLLPSEDQKNLVR